jgi:phosphoribosylformylglycinamidine synthase PurS subunit
VFLAKISILFKPAVYDPQGLTVKEALRNLNFTSIEDVRMGKYLEIKIQEQDRKHASQQVDEMCRKLLVNPVIETYRFELEEIQQEM